MTPELRQRVEQLLDDALGLEATQRQAFLDRACPQAPEVRAEVESLLAHYEQAQQQGLLTNPSVRPRAVLANEEAAASAPPTRAGGPPLSPLAFLPKKEPGEALPERSLGPYAIQHLISQGGFGSVYLGVRTDGQYQGRVAIKVLKRGLDTEDILRRFANEQQTLAALRKDPNIVTLLDGGSTADGRPYFVMEYVEGKPIDKYCDDHQLAIEDRLRIFHTVCSAVHYAHKNLIVHRDLKPSNILVTGKDEKGHHGVKLLDFGIAKFLNPELGGQTIVPTAHWERFFTPQYASPEQVRGDRVDSTGDIYSLGVLLYELLTGHLPYRVNVQQSNFEQVICEQRPEWPSTKIGTVEELTTSDGTTVRITPEYVSARRRAGPLKLRRKLAGDLDNIVLKALEKDPERRYRSVVELSQDIQNYLDGNPVSARGNPFGYRAGKFLSKHKGKLSAAALLFVAMACLAGWAALERGQAVQERQDADQAKTRAQEEEGKAIAAAVLARDARQRAERGELNARRYWYFYDVNKARQAWQRGHVTQTLALLYAQRPPQGKADLRNFEWYYRWRLCHTDLHTLGGHTAPVKCVALTFDGQTLATASEDRTIKLRRRHGAGWTELITLGRYNQGHNGVVVSLAFAPDGRKLASAGLDGAVKIWDVADVANAKLLTTLEGSELGVLSVAFGPDDQVVAGGTDRTVRLWDLKKPGQVKAWPHKAAVYAVALSADGKRAASGSSLGEVKLWDIATEKELIPAVKGHKGIVNCVAFAPDGKTLASGGDDTTVMLWDLAQPLQQAPKPHTLRGHTGAVHALAFALTADRETLLATASADTSAKLWQVSDGGQARELSTFRGHAAQLYAVAISPDRKTLVTGSADQTIKIWDATTEQERDQLRGHKAEVACLAYSGDGKMLATGSADATVRLWDPASGTECGILKGHAGGVNGLAFASDGKTLACSTKDGTVRLWDLPSKQLRKTLPGRKCPLMVFAPDGNTLAMADGRVVMLWNLADAQPRHLGNHKHAVYSLAFTPDGKTLASGSWTSEGGERLGEVKLWSLAGPEKELTTLTGHRGPITALAFADGNTLASGSWLVERGLKIGELTLWDVQARRPRASLRGHADSITAAAFTADGSRLATASTDKTVRLWDVTTGEEVDALASAAEPVLCLAFAPAGRQLAAGCLSGTVILWNAATNEMVDARMPR